MLGNHEIYPNTLKDPVSQPRYRRSCSFTCVLGKRHNLLSSSRKMPGHKILVVAILFLAVAAESRGGRRSSRDEQEEKEPRSSFDRAGKFRKYRL